MNILTIAILLSLLVAGIFASPKTNGVSSWIRQFRSLDSKLSRHALPVIISSLAFSNIHPALAEFTPSPWNKDILYEKVKTAAPDAPMPKIGDTVSVRFVGKYSDKIFDDTFKTEEPYMFRAGVGLVVKGMDDSVMQMHVGDRLKLKFGGDYAFPNGKPSSPGRPRISPGAEIEYEVSLS